VVVVTHLLESGTRTKRSLGGAVPSIALHGALILLAVNATAHAALHADVVKQTLDTVIFQPPHTPRHHTTSHTRSTAQRTQIMATAPTPIIPTFAINPDFANVKTALPIVSARDFDSGPAAVLSKGPGGDWRDSIFSETQVDRAATPSNGTAAPEYPDAMRAEGVEGSVLVQFVVDTNGAVRMGSIRVLASPNALFTESVRSTLGHAHFRPALAAGMPVRQLVQQTFSFVLR
jgi:TonB family protein